MKFNATFGGILALLLAGILLFLFLRFKGDAKKLVTETINPLSDKNIINRGVSAVVQGATGDSEATLGTKLFDWVDSIKDILPFMQSEREREAQRQREALNLRAASQSSTQVIPDNPSNILIRFPKVAGDEFE